MKYLTLSADYMGRCIKDAYNEQDNKELQLPADFTKKLDDWCSKYKFLIPMDIPQRKVHSESIKQLDQEGIELAMELKQILGGDVKVQYYSEGRLCYLEKC